MEKNSKNNLYILVGISTITSVLYKSLNSYQLEQSSLLFIGIPALITILLVKYSKKPKSQMGFVMQTITIFLLLSSIILGEGTICIIMAAPLFYGIAALIILALNYFQKDDSEQIPFMIFPLIIILTQPFAETHQIQSVKTSMKIDHPVSFNELKKEPVFAKNLPSFLTIGFPAPVSTSGKGIQIGDVRKIEFKSQTKGIGTLSLKVVDKTNTKMVFEIIHDDTHIDHWLSWTNTTVEIIADGNQTEIQWTSEYVCNLGPKWYFEPLEAYAVDLMNQHLIKSYFQEN